MIVVLTWVLGLVAWLKLIWPSKRCTLAQFSPRQLKRTQENTWKNKRSKEESTPNQLSWKTKRKSCTGYTGAHAPIHPEATGYTGAMAPVHPDSAAGLGWRKRQYHRLHRCATNEHRSIHSVILKRACIWGDKCLFRTSYTGGLILDHRCIHSGIDQRLCNGQWRKILQHRLHRCRTLASTGAILSNCHNVRLSTVTIWF